eukprot:2561645-Prymnesium_polylepis.1
MLRLQARESRSAATRRPMAELAARAAGAVAGAAAVSAAGAAAVGEVVATDVPHVYERGSQDSLFPECTES